MIKSLLLIIYFLIYCTSILSTNINNEELNITEKIQLYAQYTGATYCSKREKLISWACPKHCENKTAGSELIKILYNSKLGIKGLFIRNIKRKELILTFRGSFTKINWDYNGKDELVPLRLGNLFRFEQVNNLTLPKVHKGFLTYAEGLRDQYLKAVEEELQNLPTWTLIIAGHSSGGALANLAGLDINYHLNISKPEVFTFGQPRTGDQEFAKYTTNKLKLIRSIQDQDPIPSVPYKSLGYVHGAKEVYFKHIDRKNKGKGIHDIYLGDSNTIESESKIGFNNVIKYSANDHVTMLGVEFDNFCNILKRPYNLPLYALAIKLNRKNKKHPDDKEDEVDEEEAISLAKLLEVDQVE